MLLVNCGVQSLCFAEVIWLAGNTAAVTSDKYCFSFSRAIVFVASPRKENACTDRTSRVHLSYAAAGGAGDVSVSGGVGAGDVGDGTDVGSGGPGFEPGSG